MYRLKEGYLLKEVAGEYVLFPTGQSVVEGKNIVRVNEAGKYIVERLQEGIEFNALINVQAEKYEATQEDIPKLVADTDFFLSKLRLQGLLIE